MIDFITIFTLIIIDSIINHIIIISTTNLIFIGSITTLIIIITVNIIINLSQYLRVDDPVNAVENSSEAAANRASLVFKSYDILERYFFFFISSHIAK